MSDVQEATFRFVNFFVRQSHFELNRQGEFRINVNFNPTGLIFKSLNQFQLQMLVDITEESEMFKITLDTVSLFEFDKDADIEAYKNSLFIANAPAIAFPYIRAYIANLTTQSGIFNVTLPTLNMGGLSEVLKANIKEME